MEKSTYHHPRYESAIRRLAAILQRERDAQTNGEVVLTIRLKAGLPDRTSIKAEEFQN